MKQLSIFIIVLSAFSIAHAEQVIELSPGSSTKIRVEQETVIKCGGSSLSSGSGCSLKRSTYGAYDVYSSGQFVEQYSSLDSALALIEKLRKAGACGN